MAYSATATLRPYRQAPAWQYAAAFIVVSILHGMALRAWWVPADPLDEPPQPLRMLARTIILPVERPNSSAPPTHSVVPQPKAIATPSLEKAETLPLQAPQPEPPRPITPVVAPVVSKPAFKPVETKKPVVSKTKMSKPIISKPAALKTVTPSPAPSPSRAIAPKSAEPKQAVTKSVPTVNSIAAPSPLPVKDVPAQYGVAYLQNPAPTYPMLSRRRREQGTVHLLVWVTTAGTAEKVQLAESSGFARLDEAALATVKRWRFVPARRGDVPVASTVKVPIVFALN